MVYGLPLSQAQGNPPVLAAVFAQSTFGFSKRLGLYFKQKTAAGRGRKSLPAGGGFIK
jgi:hypothetical protein